MAYLGKVPADVLIDPMVDSAAITDATIVTADLANDAVTSAKLAADSVDSSELVNGSVDNAHLAGSIAMNKTNLTAGTGLTLSTDTLSVDAAQTQITSVGTIGTGVWNGTAIASAYLDADTAHLSGTQTFSGAKTFSTYIQLNPSASTSSYIQFASGGTTYGYVGSESSIVGSGTAADMTIGASGDTNLTLTTNGVVRATLNSDGIYLGRLFTGEHNSDYGEIGEGYYIDGNTAKYRYSDTATRLYMGANQFHFYGAAAGTADNNITWVHKMGLDASGNLGIGTSSPGANLDISHATDPRIRLTRAEADVNAHEVLGTIQFASNDPSAGAVGASIQARAEATWGTNDYPTHIRFLTTPDNSGDQAEVFRITDSGNVVMQTGKGLYFDGGSHTYIKEGSGDTLNFYTGGNNTMTLNDHLTLTGNLTVGGAIMQEGADTFAHFGREDSDSRILLGSQGGDYSSGSTNGWNNIRAHGGGLMFNTAAADNTFVFEHNGNWQFLMKPADNDSTFAELQMRSPRDGGQGCMITGYTTTDASDFAQIRFIRNGSSETSFEFRNQDTGNSLKTTKFYYNGLVYNPSDSSSWNTASDVRIKKDINDLTDAVDVLKKIRPISYKLKKAWTDEKGHEYGRVKNGFIADEYKDVFPNAVVADKNPVKVGNETYDNFLSLDQEDLVPYLVKAVQELSAKVEALESN